jgi:hypothetical protein
VDSSTVKLDEPAPLSAAGSEVEVRLTASQQSPVTKLSQVLRDLPPGTRSDADIDEQIREERAAWDE